MLTGTILFIIAISLLKTFGLRKNQVILIEGKNLSHISEVLKKCIVERGKTKNGDEYVIVNGDYGIINAYAIRIYCKDEGVVLDTNDYNVLILPKNNSDKR